MAEGDVMRITEALLRQHGACSEQARAFGGEWPDGCEVTEETVARAAALGLDAEWAADRLLSDEAREAYLAVERPALEAYRAATQPAWEAYRAAKQPARAAFLAVQQQAREAYRAECWRAFFAGWRVDHPDGEAA